MTTARERALENAKARFFDSARTVNPTPAQEYVCRVAVYEASDVWEPLLSDLLRAIKANGIAGWAPWMQEAVLRAEEALGES